MNGPASLLRMSEKTTETFVMPITLRLPRAFQSGTRRFALGVYDHLVVERKAEDLSAVDHRAL